MARTAADWDRLLPEQAPERIIERLEAAREAAGMNYSEFARRAEITPQQYRNWRAGEGRLSLHHAVAFAKAHRLPMDYICLGELAAIRPYSRQADIAARLRARERRNRP